MQTEYINGTEIKNDHFDPNDKAHWEKLLNIFRCDCGKLTQSTYIFPATINPLQVDLKIKKVVFVGETKKMCRGCYSKSWNNWRKAVVEASILSDTNNIVVKHIYG